MSVFSALVLLLYPVINLVIGSRASIRMSLAWLPLKLGQTTGTCMTQAIAKPGEMERQRLISRLFCLGLSSHAVEGDGNCQFRAISHQLYGDESYHANVRDSYVSYI